MIKHLLVFLAIVAMCIACILTAVTFCSCHQRENSNWCIIYQSFSALGMAVDENQMKLFDLSIATHSANQIKRID